MTISSDPDVLLNLVSGAKELAYDVETTGLDWKRNDVIGYSVSDGATSAYVPVRHSSGNIDNAIEFEGELSRRLAASSNTIVGHNLKFDLLFSLNHGVKLDNHPLVCTMVSQALVNEHTPRFSLGALAKSYGVTPKIEQVLYNHISMATGCKATRDSMGNFHRLPGTDELAIEYAAGDTLSTYELYQAQKKQIELQELGPIFKVENELTMALVAMERRGIAVNADRIDAVLDEVTRRTMEAKLELGDNWNINARSRGQLEEYFQLSEISDWPTTARGNPSFTASVLSDTPEGELLLEVKKYEHFTDAFFKPFLSSHVYKGVVHTSFNQVKGDDYGTVTGRLSSSNPNMQQIPKRDKAIGKLFRSLFKARDGYLIAEMDYSQCEPRLYSHYSNEPRLVRGYNSTPFIDMHSIVSEMLRIERDPAKVLNLAIMYAMGASKLAKKLKVKEEVAREYLYQWNGLFPVVRKWSKRAVTVAEQRTFVRTILGRRRRFPNPNGAYRAPNAIIQGGSADILKYKMVELHTFIQSLPADTLHMLLNIHDAIVFEVADTPQGLTALGEAKRILENVNVEPFKLRVPFVAEAKTGRSWDVATYGEYF